MDQKREDDSPDPGYLSVASDNYRDRNPYRPKETKIKDIIPPRNRDSNPNPSKVTFKEKEPI